MKYKYLDAEKLIAKIWEICDYASEHWDVEEERGAYNFAKRLTDFIDSLQQEQPECIYGRTLEERKKYCKFCSAICKARIEQKPAERNEEDERIRKEIVSIIEQYGRVCKKEGDPCDDISVCLDWLEKQKEQKPAECIADSAKFDEGFKTGREIGFREGVESVKSTEWSEEDKEYLAACIDVIDNFYTLSGELKTFTKINVLRREYAEKLKSWLKSLPERFNLQPKAEWTEEDENMFEKCISRMTDIIPVTGKSGGIKDMTFETHTEMECVKWLKKKFNR